MPVEVVLPGVLAELAGGRRLEIYVTPPATINALLQVVADTHPGLYRRLCDETGTLRRFVNIYVDGTDIRHTDGVATPITDGSSVQILPSVAGG